MALKPKQAACDPCRKAKVACDHTRPVCSRCRNGRKSTACTYRGSPFRRNRAELNRGITSNPSTRGEDPLLAIPTQLHPRRDPGYLGPSSHVTIFNRIDHGIIQGADDATNIPPPSLLPPHFTSPSRVKEAANLLLQLHGKFDLIGTSSLITFWLAKGVNLALAEPFVQTCMEVMEQLRLTLQANQHGSFLETITRLLHNSGQPFEFHAGTDLAAYLSQLSGQEARLECLGICLAAVARASIDIPFFPPVYTTETERLELRTLIQSLNDSLLGLCLSLECLNDLQLVFQYENWILHSYTDGDQSKFELLTDEQCFVDTRQNRSNSVASSGRHHCLSVRSRLS